MKKLYSVIGMVLVLALVLSLVTNYFSGAGEVEITGDEDNIYEVVNASASFGDGNNVYLSGNCVSGTLKQLGGKSYREYDVRTYDYLEGYVDSYYSSISLKITDLQYPCKIDYNFSYGDYSSLTTYDPDTSYAKLKYVLTESVNGNIIQSSETSVDKTGEGHIYLSDIGYVWDTITFEIEANSIWYSLRGITYTHYKLIDSGVTSIKLSDELGGDLGKVNVPEELIELEDYGAGVGEYYNYVDLSEGKYYQYVKTLTLTGDEDWKLYSDNSSTSKEFGQTNCFYLNIDGKLPGFGTSICDLFENTNNSYPYDPQIAYSGIYTDHTSFSRIYVDWGDLSGSVDSFKAFLSRMRGEGLPVTLKYVLSEPIVTDVSGILSGKRLDVELRGVDHLVLISPSRGYVPFAFSYVRFKEI